jgi:hypothetical protein
VGRSMRAREELRAVAGWRRFDLERAGAVAPPRPGQSQTNLLGAGLGAAIWTFRQGRTEG